MSKKQSIIGSVLLWGGIFLIALTIWYDLNFETRTISSLIFTSTMSITGTGSSVIISFFLWTVPISVVVAIGIVYFVVRFRRTRANAPKVLLKTGMLCLVLSMFVMFVNYDVMGYVTNILKISHIYEDHYVDPEKADVTFEGKKRNLIHIYLESIENTYLSREEGGGLECGVMPELSALARENVNFSHNKKIGGPLSVEGTQWSMGSTVAQSMGVHLYLPLFSRKYDENTAFLPGAFSIGDILAREGYNQELLYGSDSKFGAMYNFFVQHGNFSISDYNTAKANKQIDEDYSVFWGYEDKKLFEFAKESLTALSNQDKPFNLTMATMDAHAPDGYFCDICERKHENKYQDIVACQSKQVGDFVQWIKAQDFYKDTLIVITGDHLSMADKYFLGLDKECVRTPYMVIINSAVSTNNTKDRQYCQLDMYPTILAALGANINGDRLGLGTNLFSEKKTLIEEKGFNIINNELRKTSRFYNSNILQI